jgi:hypothetical protein
MEGILETLNLNHDPLSQSTASDGRSQKIDLAYEDDDDIGGEKEGAGSGSESDGSSGRGGTQSKGGKTPDKDKLSGGSFAVLKGGDFIIL